jgi:ribose/xylose/arabinose/galactoside ABC-type transport system permease subunit
MVMVLANCLASSIVVGSPPMAALGVLGVLFVGGVCGAINGLIVIYGRLQPIVTTIATGAVFYGAALALRPVPGGDIDSTLADALTGQLQGGVPASLALLLALVVIVWLPFRRSAIGRAAYAVGSSEVAAYMSGVPIRRAKFVAYTLSGVLASIAGLFLTCVTYSGEASAANGSTYTLYSIAAWCLGGVSLFGGSGSAIGAIFGALHVPHDRRSALRVQRRAAVAAAVPGDRAGRGGLPGRGPAAAHPQPAGSVWLTRPFRQPFRQHFRQRCGPLAPAHRPGDRVGVRLHRDRAARRQPLFDELPVAEYLLQQLKVASFLGVIATGMMIVILWARSTCRCRGSLPSAG